MNQVLIRKSAPIVRSLYVFSMIFLGLTGFAQMPIFKRYYIADIPGLGWLAHFYVTHYMHYLGAILLLALAAYVLVEYFAGEGRHRSLTASGYARGAVIGALILSGVLLVVRNQSGVHLGPRLIIFLDLFHMGLAMALIATSTYCLARKRPWLR
jgi:putative Mn2+ efflux pump MntP